MAAAKKEAQEVNETEILDPWKEKVTVFIPRKIGEETHQYVAVNGRGMLVQKGRSVEVPKPIAEVINTALAAAQQADDEADEKSQRFLDRAQKYTS